MLTPLTLAANDGLALANVSLLRLDTHDHLAPGNKRFKLQAYIDQAKAQGCSTLVSFGGAWSNHLHALAALGAESGFATVGIVRCEPHEAHSATLQEARAWGMQILAVGRAEYKKRHLQAYQDELHQRFSPCVVIPEGGASLPGAQGCADIAKLIQAAKSHARRIVLPVGTGTTLAGVAAALPFDYEVIGISALKGASDIDENIQTILQQLAGDTSAAWKVLHDYHCGGFAKVSNTLKAFLRRFESVQAVPLEPVYTAKMLFAIHQLRESGQWSEREPIIAVHTGGLQGRRGFDWVQQQE
ncbi:MAG: 1-aminocyclopropane-1-carboxylate deaminase/D-cysteine desulfhydrase [Halioglobus sp.]